MTGASILMQNPSGHTIIAIPPHGQRTTPITINPFTMQKIKHLLLLACIMVGVMSCGPAGIFNDPDILHPDPPPPPPQAICLEDTLYTEPPFVTLDLEITDASTGDRVFCAGNYCDTIHVGEFDTQDQIVDAVMEKFHPEFHYRVFVKEDDTRRMAIIVDGTNNQNLFKSRVRIKYNGLTHFLGWCIQGFIFSGALEYPEYEKMAVNYPSVALFNHRLTAYDSLDYIRLDSIILGHCKEGRDWADFRFTPFETPDSILQAYEDAGWNKVLHGFTDDGGPIDVRDRCIEAHYVRGWMNQGRQVIVREENVTPSVLPSL